MKHFQRLLLVALLCLPAFAQSERLPSSSASAASVGKGRPLAETLRPDGEISIDKLKDLDTLVAGFQLDARAVPVALEAFAEKDRSHNFVNVTARHSDGTAFYSHTSTNLRTNAGANWQADIMANTSTPSVNAQCNYIALTNDATTPVVTGTTLASEIAANGLTRAQGTYAHTSNATSYTLAKTFTASGAQSAQQTAVFTASSVGTMCFWNTFTSVTLANTDTLTVTWTVNF